MRYYTLAIALALMSISSMAAGPSIRLQSPATTRVSSVAPYTVQGTATYSGIIDRVTIQLNNGTPINATLNAGSAAVQFNAIITPEEGVNSLSITATGLDQQSSTLTRNFTFEKRRTLRVTRIVPSSQASSADNVATISLSTSPRASPLSNLKKSTSLLQQAEVIPGQIVDFNINIRKGYSFVELQGLPPDAIIKQRLKTRVTARFTMPDEDLNDITASFKSETNVPSSGNYLGMIKILNGDAGIMEWSMQVSVTSGGSFTILRNQNPIYVSGYFDADGVANFKIPNPDYDGIHISDMWIYSPVHWAFDRMSIKHQEGRLLVSDDYNSEAALYANSYTDANPVPNSWLNRTSSRSTTLVEGYFTYAVNSDDLMRPRCGIGAGIITKSGKVRFAGNFSEGGIMTFATSVVNGDQIPFADATGNGFFGGWVTIDTNNQFTDFSGDISRWSSYTWTSSNLTFSGSFYDSSYHLSEIINSSGTGAVQANAYLQLSNEETPSPTIKTLVIKQSNVIIINNEYADSLSFNIRTGMLSGKYFPVGSGDPTKITINGIVLQKQRFGYGYTVKDRITKVGQKVPGLNGVPIPKEGVFSLVPVDAPE